MKMNDWKLNERLKIERTLNFSTITHEEDDLSYSRRKVARDPMSHRIIEKRRRDRMNNCLADLSRLIPHQYMKKSRGRIEKTEIIEMAIKHLKHLQAHSCKDLANCDVAKATEQEWQHQYRLGFQECTSEAVRFLVESEGLFPAEGICFRLLAHLQEHYDKLTRGCYQNGRVGSQLAHEDSNSTQMDVEGPTIHNGNSVEGFSVSPVKRANSPPPFEPQTTPLSVPQQQQHNHHSQNGDYQPDERCQVMSSVSASQLREMLQNPNVPIERVRSNSASSTASSYSSKPYLSTYDGYPKNQTCEEVYKFKNNIKDRFHADLHHHVDEAPGRFSVDNVVENGGTTPASFSSPSVTKCRSGALTGSSSGNVLVTQTKNPSNTNSASNPEVNAKNISEGDLSSVNCNQNDPQTDSSNGSSSPVSNARSNGSTSGYSTSGDTPIKPKLQQTRSQSPDPGVYPRRHSYSASTGRPSSPYVKSSVVPIFALHPKGNFYIPMSLEPGLLSPYLHGVDHTVPVLHPVSISVNFCGPVSFATPDHVSWHPPHTALPQIQHNGIYDRYRDQSY